MSGLLDLLEALLFSTVQDFKDIVPGPVLQKFPDIRYRDIHFTEKQDDLQRQVLGRR